MKPTQGRYGRPHGADHRSKQRHRQSHRSRAGPDGRSRCDHRPGSRPHRGRCRRIHAAGGRTVDSFVADLSSQAEVRRLASEVWRRLARIDVLINNVGGYWNTRHVTADGLERTFALNHLAPFLLTDLLLDRLQDCAPARIITVSSDAQSMGRIDFDDLQGERSYSGARAYNQSKLANLLFTYQLARRLSDTTSPPTRSTPAW